jgi:hypothetical protein
MSPEKLVRMANQIATFFSSQPKVEVSRSDISGARCALKWRRDLKDFSGAAADLMWAAPQEPICEAGRGGGGSEAQVCLRTTGLVRRALPWRCICSARIRQVIAL